MKNSFRYLFFTCLIALNSNAQQSILKAQFSAEEIIIDGKEEGLWDVAAPKLIEKAMTANLSEPDPDCRVLGDFKAIWNGSRLYLLIKVRDGKVTSTATKISEKDGIEVFLDLWNDKYPKYEEDDAMIQIASDGTRFTRGTIADRFESSATSIWKDKRGTTLGYYVELAINVGGVKQENGSEIGFEIGIREVDPKTEKVKNRIFWADGNNNALNNNTNWGTILFDGYDGTAIKAMDEFVIKKNIAYAEGLNLEIWQEVEELQRSLHVAKVALGENSQERIDAGNVGLKTALNNLRRKGDFPDPKDLVAIDHLPDPFLFQDGTKVESPSDWEKRGDEIKDLAQYYEYGNFPEKPEKLWASLDSNKILVNIENDGIKTQFEAQISLPQDKEGPFPVVVSIDFRSREPNQIYLDAGYAVLSIRYTAIASDNFEHTGPFYELYPYDITKGRDTGTLLAWAWGAIRSVDALEYLVEQNDSLASSLDLDKLVVTGFSRCGKAALAAGLFDDRFKVVSPGASGCGGAAVFRYVSFGNTPFSQAPFGHEYDWGSSFGCEVMGDKIRHQGHNSNEMLARFLNTDRIYKTNNYGYGERLPYDHHEIIAAIAPRAVLINTANDDYANNAEGDAIGYEGAKSVFEFMGVPENLGLNIRTTGEAHPRGFGGGHWLSDAQINNIVAFSDKIFYQKKLDEKTKNSIYKNPYLSTFDKYFGGLESMMPWR